MHNLFLVYFINLYMFRAYLGPSSGGTPYGYNSWYLLFFFLDDSLLSWLDWNLIQPRQQAVYKKCNATLFFLKIVCNTLNIDFTRINTFT